MRKLKFEDTKRAIMKRKLKTDRQYNDGQKKDKRTNNDLCIVLHIKIKIKVALYKNLHFFIKIFFNQFLFYYNILDTQVKK